MSLGLRDERRRRRRHFRQTLFRWLLAVAVVGGAAVYAYQKSAALAERGVAARDEQIRGLAAQIDELQARSERQAAGIAAESARAEEWRQRYERDVATGETKELFNLLQGKLAQGVGAQRLRWVIERTESRRVCDAGQQVKRALVQTPISGGVQTPATFAGGAITLSLSLSGTSARDAAGAPEAWFDPKLPVTVRLTRPGGETAESSGPLPLRPSLVDGDREYRFNIVAGPRGFAQITMERCRFP